ncbi:zinc finger protein 184-like isoform X2 [Nymphalis io]|uniref:zinc finger protein 184-like isoform X2 n=1 Tax=Inachis io TaxID=171585 RepID=UPI00216721B7|nr:zinc finger protein 184-like isoform X2 [Nymphalis io]
MEVFLYNSTVCRLCGEENDNGTLLYSSEENNQNLSEIINSYLPLKVSDDGELPRTICPGCTIQLEASVEFLNLIINGQKIIRELYQREREYKKNILNTSSTDTPDIISEKIIYEINTSDGVYQVEHPISLQVAGLEKPKRKRGRPPKKPKSPEEIAQEAAVKEQQEVSSKTDEKEEEEPSGKRRRKAPTRFKEAVQGKELERIFIEVGVIEGEEAEKKPKADTVPKEPEVIGHLEDSGELVVVVKGKGRGRPKGRTRQTREQCAVCGAQFSSRGRYMSHVAAHGHALQQRRHTEPENTDPVNETEITAENAEAAPVNKPEDDVQSEPVPQALPDLTDASEYKDKAGESTDPLKVEEEVDVVGEDPNDKNSETVSEASEDEIEVQTEKGKVKLKCNHCDKLFSNRQSKSLHIKAVHFGVKSYACTECDASFAYPQSLAVHRVSHRRFRPTGGYACDLCGKVLNHPSSVVYHKQAEHAAQRYVCGTCGKHFRHKQLLQRHQLVHSQLRPFTCKTCNATFKTKANLLNHQLLHSGIKKFSCDICKQKFAHKTSLTLHMRWHTGVKPFSCAVCGKSFSQKGNLSEHERIHTGEKPYQCALCPRRFTTSSQHRLHARRHSRRAAHDRYVTRHTPYQCAQHRLHARRHSRRAAHDRTTIVRRDDAGVRRRRLLARSKNPKQISLLVNDKIQPEPQVQLQQTQHQELQKLEVHEETETEERVIYVAYDADDSNATAFHILDPEQAVNIEEHKVLTTCELYSGSSLLVPQQLEQLKVEMEPEQLELEHEEMELDHEELQMELEQEEMVEQIEMAREHLMLEEKNIPVNVTDEEGNPLHFTMQDGTKLAITSIDGKSLQVITQDGQTIPVEINGINEEEEAMSPDTVVHHLNIQKVEANSSPVTHYYTIV